MAIGERIKLARINAGLSQQALGNEMGLSKMAISKYETGMIVPKSGILIALGRALGVNTEFFFRSTKINISTPVYRCRKKLGKKEEAKILGEVANWLERYITVEQLTGYETPLTLPKREDCRVQTLEDIEKVASWIRMEWNLGLDPIENLMDVLEQHGIKIGQIVASDKFDALTLWHDEKCPIIAVNKTFPGDRQRYNLAHELGHLLMQIDSEIDTEKAAHRFAGAFLVPKEMAFLELGTRRKWLDFRELYVLKHKYGLSMAAWVHRAADLEIISASAVKRHWTQMTMNGWRKAEPGHPYPSESPTHMQLLLYRALTEQKISQSRFLELFGEENVKAAEPCT